MTSRLGTGPQLFALRRFSEKVAASPDEPTRQVMARLAVLYGLWSLERSYVTYLAAGQLTGIMLHSAHIAEA